MSMKIEFTAYCRPQPQGSIQSFILPNKEAVEEAARAIHRHSSFISLVKIIELITAAVKKTRAILTSDNSNLKAYRKEVTRCAVAALKAQHSTIAIKHEAVEIKLDFVFERPPSVSKKRMYPVVKPDIDKLERATLDALTGHAYEDDAQVVTVSKSKRYGPQECVTVSVWSIEDLSLYVPANLFPDFSAKELAEAKKKIDEEW
jgi:Holliday junction resolvase RusA-like endonuclease